MRRLGMAVALALVTVAGCSSSAHQASRTPTHITLPGRGATVLIFGDSWTYGINAYPPDRYGYAYLVGDHFGWHTQVAGGPGTGFLNPDGKRGTYAQRFAALSVPKAPALVIIQGGLNDVGYPANALSKAAAGLIASVEHRFPRAQVVMLGSISAAGPGNPGVDAVDSALRLAAVQASVPFVDPNAQQWFTTTSLATYIDPRDQHPNDAGHAHYALRLEQALVRLGA